MAGRCAVDSRRIAAAAASRLRHASAQSNPCGQAAAVSQIHIRGHDRPCTSFEFGSVCYAIPTEIVPAIADTQFVVGSRYGVAKRLKLITQEERIVGEHCSAGFRREIRFIRRAPPNVIAGINRLHVRNEVGADARAKPIASNKKIGALTAPVGKMNVNAATVLLNALEDMSEMIALPVDRL